jgi:hypothetical protein
MTQITVQIPDALAAQINAANLWLPTILELNFTRFQTRAAEAAEELRKFLAQNPLPVEVTQFSFSGKVNRRRNSLLELNSVGRADDSAKRELDEWAKLYHITTMLNGKALGSLKRQ